MVWDIIVHQGGPDSDCVWLLAQPLFPTNYQCFSTAVPGDYSNLFTKESLKNICFANWLALTEW